MAYVRQLEALYYNQTAAVKTDRQHRAFSTQRGVKQADPLSSLLFNACLEQLAQQLKEKWSTQAYGIQLGFAPETWLTNLRFADDILLISTTLPQLTHMLIDLRREAKQYGLEIHPGKTNCCPTRLADEDEMHAQQFVIPFDGDTKYLRRNLSFNEYHVTELSNRINAAWRKFNLLRHELTSITYPLGSRLQFFDATVTSTVVYGRASWTMAKSMSASLKRAQRHTLRLILNAPRRRAQPRADKNSDNQSTDDVNSNQSNATYLENVIHFTDDDLPEPFQDLLRGTTHTAEALALKNNVEDLTTHCLRQ